MLQGSGIFPLMFYSCSSSSGESLIFVCVCVCVCVCVRARMFTCHIHITQLSTVFGCTSILNWELQVSGLGWSRPNVGYGFWTTDQTYCTARCNAKNWWEADAYVFCNISQRDTGKYNAHPFSAGMSSHMLVLQNCIEKKREYTIYCHILIIS